MKRCFSSVKDHGTIGCIILDKLEVWYDSDTVHKLLAFMIIERIDYRTIHPHIFIHEQSRSHTMIKLLRDNIRTTFKDYMEEISKDRCLISCPDDAPKSKRLIELLGFKLKPIWCGSMDF